MKKILVTLFFMAATVGTVFAQYNETRKLSDFNKIKFEGRAKIYLIQDDNASVKIETKRESYLEEFKTEVRNGTLYLGFEDDRDNDRRIKLYVSHTGNVEDIDLSGFVTLITNDPLTEERLNIDADGFIKGNIDVAVDRLNIDTNGFVSFTVSGKANTARLEVNGFGRINAKELDTKKVKKEANGFTGVRLK